MHPHATTSQRVGCRLEAFLTAIPRGKAQTLSYKVTGPGTCPFIPNHYLWGAGNLLGGNNNNNRNKQTNCTI
jgi:hypothetical protein